MTDSTSESPLTKTSGLLTYYSCETGSQTQEYLLNNWLGTYPPEWVRLALIEALYRGRYKTISVESLLADWERRGQPLYHFNREFEALVCHNFPKLRFTNNSAPDSGQTSSQPLPSELIKREGQGATFFQNLSTKTDGHNSQLAPFDQSARSSASDTLPPLSPWPLTSENPQSWDSESDLSPFYELSALPEEHDAPEPHSDQQNMSEVALKVGSRSVKVAPIHQFTPDKKSSEHFQKLAAMVSE